MLTPQNDRGTVDTTTITATAPAWIRIPAGVASGTGTVEHGSRHRYPLSRENRPLKVLLIVGVTVFVLLGGCVALLAVVGSNGSTAQRRSPTGDRQPSAADLDPKQYQAISPRDYALLLKTQTPRKDES
jgi:hypothetical protein